MKKYILFLLFVILFSYLVIGCAKSDKGRETLVVEEVDPQNPGQSEYTLNFDDNFFNDTSSTVPNGTNNSDAGDDFHPIFSKQLGMVISRNEFDGTPDQTGQTIVEDYDGDGIPNDQEVITNPYVADYPRIVTRIVAPITMELRVSETSSSENYSETVNETDLKDTISNSMEDKHYTSANKKTTPYVTKESLSTGGKHSSSYGYTNSDSISSSNEKSISHSQNSSNSRERGGGTSFQYGDIGGSVNFSIKDSSSRGRSNSFSDKTSNSNSTSRSRNQSVADEFSRSKMNEKTVFQDVDYVDNLDKHGVEFKNETVKNISNNFRKKSKELKEIKIGPNAGYVRASLYIKNPTIDMPAQVSNIICTLSFRTPSGLFLPVSTFRLRHNDYSEFKQKIYGGDEMGPFTIEVNNLNTNEVKKALRNGYVPQIHVVSYDIKRIDDSNYNPGVDDLKIVEEVTKKRTAVIKIVGSGFRELYRVSAFDIDEYGNMSPGISLKKALFNIFKQRIGTGEKWDTDSNGKQLTVQDGGLKWKAGAQNAKSYVFTDNKSGNSWKKFETYVKSYVDEYDQVHHIETIKRIESLSKYNPFNKTDNPNYNPNELLARDEALKMKFWVVMHNGRYYEGDLNDPIWAGERYEIVCMDMRDLNQHFENYIYTPIQSGEWVFLDTRWNALTEEKGEFARAIYLGRVMPNELIKLEVDLIESRFLFRNLDYKNAFGSAELAGDKNYYYNFNYTFQKNIDEPIGIPENFNYSAEGGTNKITVTIANSNNARSYRISFSRLGVDNSETKNFTVTQNELNAQNGIIVLNGQTPGVGKIEGSTTSEGHQYKVEVEAVGVYSVYKPTEVTTKGTSNNSVAYVFEAVGNPAPFDFGASGNADGIEVRITPSIDAEYYVIKYRGPYNYLPGDPPVKEIVARDGFNFIMLDTVEKGRPTIKNLEEKNYEPGLYSIEVYSRNTIVQDDAVGAASNQRWVTVDYDKYKNQRNLIPKISEQRFDLNAIDLEVNFNDGSGWFKLQPTDPYVYGDKGDPSETIDCYSSSYMELDKQKFHLSFIAPGTEIGYTTGLPNVFKGMRPETDLYVRTIPKNEYRDSVWVRPDFNADNEIVTYLNYTETDKYASLLLASISDDFNIVDYWLSQFNTDATNFENTIVDLYTAGVVSSTNLENFFFAPVEHRFYALKVAVTDEVNITPPTRPLPPALNARYAYHDDNIYADIHVEGVKADNSRSYTLYYTNGIIAQEDWPQYQTWMIRPYSITSDPDKTKNNFMIPNLTSGAYTFCVHAENKYGISDPKCETMTIDPVNLIPEKPTVTAERISDDVVRFTLTSVSPNSTYHTIYYKKHIYNADLEISPSSGKAIWPWQQKTIMNIDGNTFDINVRTDFKEPTNNDLTPLWNNFDVRIHGYNDTFKMPSQTEFWSNDPDDDKYIGVRSTQMTATTHWNNLDSEPSSYACDLHDVIRTDYDGSINLTLKDFNFSGIVSYSVSVTVQSEQARYSNNRIVRDQVTPNSSEITRNFGSNYSGGDLIFNLTNLTDGIPTSFDYPNFCGDVITKIYRFYSKCEIGDSNNNCDDDQTYMYLIDNATLNLSGTFINHDNEEITFSQSGISVQTFIY